MMKRIKIIVGYTINLNAIFAFGFQGFLWFYALFTQTPISYTLGYYFITTFALSGAWFLLSKNK